MINDVPREPCPNCLHGQPVTAAVCGVCRFTLTISPWTRWLRVTKIAAVIIGMAALATVCVVNVQLYRQSQENAAALTRLELAMEKADRSDNASLEATLSDIETDMRAMKRDVGDIDLKLLDIQSDVGSIESIVGSLQLKIGY